MERKEFLSLVGKGAGGALFLSILASCSKQVSSPSSSGKVDFTLDLTNSQYSALQTDGGFVYVQNVIVAKTINGNYVAVSAVCTHQGAIVQYTTINNSFFCPVHGSDFSTSGAVLRGPAYTPLTQYKTALSGNSLRVYS
ncbi:MAG: ubiquinol-cytochrome c reductase iron-sulfur subunit [Chitinophagaceae bacterium]